MQAALSGYFTIWTVIGVGWLAAQLHILDDDARRLLSRLAFTIASPVLLFTLVAGADLRHLFSGTLVVSALAIAVMVVSYLAAARIFLGPGRLADRVIGALCSGYTNAGNLGLPVAAYVLGDMTWMAPILLIQIGILQPTALALLDVAAARGTGERLRWTRYVTLPLRNPLTVGTLAGLVVNASGIHLPELVWAPASMVGAMAVPAMLIAFGISLRLDPLPGRGPHARELVIVTIGKVLLHPGIAFILAWWVFRLPIDQVLAVTVIAALPTAQNIFVIAGRYRVGYRLARDAIFISTIASIPVIIAASTWLR
jgi:malonate transporter and related proteins